MFDGHELLKLVNNSWVLDLTDNTIYKVCLDINGQIEGAVKAVDITINNGEIEFERYINVPARILKEAHTQLERHDAIGGRV